MTDDWQSLTDQSPGPLHSTVSNLHGDSIYYNPLIQKVGFEKKKHFFDIFGLKCLILTSYDVPIDFSLFLLAF
jgi:hypothetical protein